MENTSSRIRHQCLCGYRAPNYSRYRRHQLRCDEWRNRPDPRRLALWRRKLAKDKVKQTQGVPTPEELRTLDRFRRVLERHPMSLRKFCVFLRLLERRFSR